MYSIVACEKSKGKSVATIQALASLSNAFGIACRSSPDLCIAYSSGRAFHIHEDLPFECPWTCEERIPRSAIETIVARFVDDRLAGTSSESTCVYIMPNTLK